MNEHKATSGLRRKFEHVAQIATRWTGGSWAFSLAVVAIVVWLASGPVFGYSNTWQLVFSTTTTIVTFLMVFLIQRAHNKESAALQLKLNEVVAALDGASNRLVNVEALSEQELDVLNDHYRQLAEHAKRDRDICGSHSIDEARVRHQRKSQRQSRPGNVEERQ